MNKHLFFLTILIFVLGFSAAKAQSYDTLWNRYQHFNHRRVVDANHLLDTIEWKSLSDNDEYQLLKVCCYRASLQKRFGQWRSKDAILYVDSFRRQRSSLYQPVYDYTIGVLLRNARWYNHNLSMGRTDYHSLDEWSMQEFDAAAEACFQRAMDSCDHLIDMPLADYSFLATDNWTQRPQHCPTLFDLLVQSRLLSLGAKSNAFSDEVTTLCEKAIRIHQRPQDQEIRLSYELQRLQHLYESKQLDTTDYRMAMQDLEQRYGANCDAILYAWALFYFELDGKHFYETALPYFNALIQKSSDNYYVRNSRYYKEEIERKWLYVHGSQSDFYPSRQIPLCVAYRNVDSVYVSVYRTPQPWRVPLVTTKEMKAYHLSREDAENLKNCVSRQLFVLPSENPYDYHATDVWLDSLPVGSYVLLFHLEPQWDSTSVLMTKTIQITQVQLTGWHSDKHFFFAANHRRTGEALTHRTAVIRPYSVGLERLRHSDSEGRFTMARNIRHGEYDGTIGLDFYNRRKDAYNTYYVDESNYWDHSKTAVRRIIPVEQIALDRTLYRPRQTLYYKILLGKEGIALTDQPVRITLIDENKTVLDSAQMSTNEFGSLAGNFQVPNKVGHYQIEASYWNKQLEKGKKYYYRKSKKSKTFRIDFEVAEYRLPTFKVEAVRDTNEYALGDTVAVAGYARTLADAPLNGAQVRMQCRWQEAAGFQHLDTTVFCDATGYFVWKWATPANPIVSSLSADVTMTVTDINGESHSAYSEYTLSKKSLFLEIQLNGEVDKDTADHQIWTVYAENADKIKMPVPLSLKVERLAVPSCYKGQLFPSGARPTVWLHSEEAYAHSFPQQTINPNFNLVQEWPVAETMMQSHQVFDVRQPLTVEVKDWPVGIYRVTVEGKDRHCEVVRKYRYVQLYDSKASRATLSHPVYVRLASTVNLGDTLPVLVGTTLQDAVVYCVAYQDERPVFSQKVPLSVGQQMLYVPTNKKFNVNVSVVAYAVQNGVSYHDIRYGTLVMPEWTEPTNELNIKLTHWNRMVEPGWQQEWEMEVTTADTSQTEAEVVASMVDEAMSQLSGEPHKEFIYVGSTRYTMPKQVHSVGFFGDISSYSNHLFECSNPAPKLAYQLERLPRIQYELLSDHYSFGVESQNLRTTPGRSVSSSLNELEEVVIKYEPPVFLVGSKSEAIPASVSFAQQKVENASLKLDDWENNPHHVVIHNIEEVVDEPTAAKDDFVFNPNIRMRHSFEETAFFYPQLRTDAMGHLKFAFTVPDQFTQWNFYATAHTKDLQFGSISEKVVSRSTLMLQSNCPRFLYEGDTLSFAVKVSNLGDTTLQGFAQVSFFDPRTNQPFSLLMNAADSLQPFVCGARKSSLLRWSVAVPDGLSVIAYRVLAQSGNYGDGEERAIPVLSSRQVMAESKSFFVPEDTTAVVVFKPIKEHLSTTLQPLNYSVEVIANPAWAAVVALPYMAYEKGNHNGLISNALYANALSRHIVRNFPEIEKTYAQWTNDTLYRSIESPLLRNEEWKSLQLSESPWMHYAVSEQQQRLDMARLFQSRRLDKEWDRLLTKLSLNQLPNGGWDWYGRKDASEYVTTTIVTNYQKLLRMHIDVPEMKTMMRRAMNFLDSCASRKYQNYLKRKQEDAKYRYNLSAEDIRYLYARSLDTSNKDWMQQPYVQHILSHLLTNQEIHSYDLQAEIALVFSRLGYGNEANEMMEGIRQQAVVDEQQGMYWRCKSRDASRMVHQQVTLMEAFSEISPNEQELDRMRQWLLMQKKGNQWPSETATAEAVFALLTDDDQKLLDPVHTLVTVNHQTFSTASDMLPDVGMGRISKMWLGDEVTSALATISVQTDNEHPAIGNLFWQYLEQRDKVASSANGLSLEREFYHQGVVNRQEQLVPVTDDNPAEVGEHLTVRLVLCSAQNLEFVQIHDQHSAALEPLNFLEQHRYNGNLYYCEVPHDAATNFFIKNLPMGTSVLEYEVVVSQAGSFSNGIATAECAYAPEFRAQSQGKRIRCVYK